MPMMLRHLMLDALLNRCEIDLIRRVCGWKTTYSFSVLLEKKQKESFQPKRERKRKKKEIPTLRPISIGKMNIQSRGGQFAGGSCLSLCLCLCLRWQRRRRGSNSTVKPKQSGCGEPPCGAPRKAVFTLVFWPWCSRQMLHGLISAIRVESAWGLIWSGIGHDTLLGVYW